MFRIVCFCLKKALEKSQKSFKTKNVSVPSVRRKPRSVHDLTSVTSTFCHLFISYEISDMHFFQIKFTVRLFLSQFKTQKMCGVVILDSVGRPSLHSRIGWPDPSATQLKNTCGISQRMTGMVTNTIYLFFFQKWICRSWNLSRWHLTVILKLRIRPRRSL